MSLEWDKRVIINEGIDTNKPPRKYTFNLENFCPFCNCPRTHVEKLIKISKKISTPQNQYLIKHLIENDLKIFTTQELIKSLNAEHLTDGSLQSKQMSLLVIFGYYKRVRQEFLIKKGKKEIKKFRWIYTKNWENNPPKCYLKEKDSHLTINKYEWITTNYFDSKANKKSDGDLNE